MNRLSYLQNAEQCTHCGYCLPVCPTYRAANHENQSPRGRVSAVLAHRQGRLTEEELAATLSHCMLCHACHRACPAGVKPARMALSVRNRHPMPPPGMARLLHQVTDRHGWTALSSGLLHLHGRSGLQGLLQALLPDAWSAWHALLPERRPLPKRWNRPTQPNGRRVALLTGCMGRLFQPAIGRSAENLLLAMGFQVVVLTGFGCCGFPHREEGDRQGFLKQAGQLLAAVARAGPVEAVVCDSGSCAATLKIYGKTLESHAEWAQQGATLTQQTLELSQFLVQEGLDRRWPMADPGFGCLTLQAHCQSWNMLGILDQPQQLLKSVPTAFRPLAECELCCGAGGSYMLWHPAQSRAVRDLKLAAVAESGADTLVGLNPGCLMNLEAGLRETGSPVQTRHLAEVLWTAFYNYRKEN